MRRHELSGSCRILPPFLRYVFKEETPALAANRAGAKGGGTPGLKREEKKKKGRMERKEEISEGCERVCTPACFATLQTEKNPVFVRRRGKKGRKREQWRSARVPYII